MNPEPILRRNAKVLDLVENEAAILMNWSKKLKTTANLEARSHTLVTVLTEAISNHNNIFFSGIGKNVPALRKVSATMMSLGIPSQVFDAVDALHGDLGALRHGDVLIAMSKSGNTDELIKTLNYIKQNKEEFGVTVFGISICPNDGYSHCHFDSMCDISIKLPMLDEMDAWNKVPTSSAIAFQMYLDGIAIAVASAVSTTSARFKLNHPGGSIGVSFIAEEVIDSAVSGDSK